MDNIIEVDSVENKALLYALIASLRRAYPEMETKFREVILFQLGIAYGMGYPKMARTLIPEDANFGYAARDILDDALAFWPFLGSVSFP